VTEADERLLARSGRAAEAAELAIVERRQLDYLQEMMGLPGPQWKNAEDSRLPDGGCVFMSGSRRCERTATHWGWIGCSVGEHLDKSGLCGEHSQAVLKLPPLNCERCWNAVRAISPARFVKIERIDDDDDPEAAVRAHPDLLP
jgi:hypothetical protein